MKKFFLILVALALLAGGGFWWRATHRPSSETALDESPTATVKVATVKQETIALRSLAFGVISAGVSAEHLLTAPYDCLVRSTLKTSGARVAKGDLLLEISPTPDFQLQLDSARSTFDLATQGLNAAQERFQLKLANSQELLTAKQAEADAKLKLVSLEARGLGGDGKIVAPVGGIVSKLDATPGSIVTSGSPLAAVTDENALVARVALEAKAVGAVAVGQPVTITTLGREEMLPVSCTITSVGNAVDPATGSVDAVIAVPFSPFFVPGQHVAASIELKKEVGLVVPRSAVLSDDGHQVLYIVQGGKALRREVRVGIATETAVEVSAENLHADDQVVVLGNYELTDGMSVKVEDKSNAAAAAEKKP